MDSKRISKETGRFIGWVGLNFSSLIIRFVPSCYIYGFASSMSFIWYRIAAKQRNIAIESLTIAFGKEKSREEIKRISEDCFVFIAKAGLELMFLMRRPKLLEARVEMEGRDNLERALSRGRGVILVSAHFGNFPLMMARLALSGYKIAGIMRPMHDMRAEKMFMKMRTDLGIKTIYAQPRITCVNKTIEALRNNELVFIPIDQNFGSGGVFVDFFGTKAATATGPVVLAQRTKAALLPCFIIRQPDDTHKIVFEPAIELKEGKNSEETVLMNIQRLTNIIEEYIRRYPAEWGWIHRRWKSKPS